MNRFYISALSLILGAGIFFSGCDKVEQKEAEVIRPVKIKKVGKGGLTGNNNTFSGIARGIEKAVLSFRVTGTLQNLNYEVGQAVKEKAIAATVDNRDYQIRVNGLKSQLRSAQAQLNKLKKGGRSEDLRILESKLKSAQAAVRSAESAFRTARSDKNRIQKLYVKKATSKRDLDKAQSNLDLKQSQFEQAKQTVETAKKELEKSKAGGRIEEVNAQQANVRAIRSNLEQAKANLLDTKLRFPFDGVLAEKHVSNFEQVNAGSAIYTIVNVKKIELQISVPDRLISFVHYGNNVSVYFTNMPGKVFLGKITKIGISADKQTLTYPVFVEIDNRNNAIRPGMTAKVVLQSKQEAASFPTIPVDAILKDKVTQEKYVWVLDQERRPKKRVIKLGVIKNNEVEVISGLKDGELIIIAGVHQIEENMKVRILSADI